MTEFLVLFVVLTALMTFLLRRKVLAGTYRPLAQIDTKRTLIICLPHDDVAFSVVVGGRGFYIGTVSR